ncbi:MAG: hypothetical protein AAF960_20320 [Bacteroidota bacterium]
MLIGFIVTIVNTVKENNEKDAGISESIEKTEKGIINTLNEAPRTTENTKIKFDELGFQVEFHKNLKFSKYPNQNFVVAHSLDSTALSYLIGEIPKKLKGVALEQEWKNQLSSANNTYEFKDSIGYTFLSLIGEGIKYKGFYRIDKLEEKYFVIQASIIENEYEENFEKMMYLVKSFRQIK